MFRGRKRKIPLHFSQELHLRSLNNPHVQIHVEPFRNPQITWSPLLARNAHSPVLHEEVERRAPELEEEQDREDEDNQSPIIHRPLEAVFRLSPEGRLGQREENVNPAEQLFVENEDDLEWLEHLRSKNNNDEAESLPEQVDDSDDGNDSFVDSDMEQNLHYNHDQIGNAPPDVQLGNAQEDEQLVQEQPDERIGQEQAEEWLGNAEERDGDDPYIPEDDPFNVEEDDSYFTILESLYRKWMLTELEHTMSQAASNYLWSVAFHFIPKLIHAREVQNVTRKVPKFNHIRRTLYTKNTPEVNLEFGYRNKESNEVTEVHDKVTPKSRFPPNEYEKMFEVGTVKVS